MPICKCPLIIPNTRPANVILNVKQSGCAQTHDYSHQNCVKQIHESAIVSQPSALMHYNMLQLIIWLQNYDFTSQLQEVCTNSCLSFSRLLLTSFQGFSIFPFYTQFAKFGPTSFLFSGSLTFDTNFRSIQGSTTSETFIVICYIGDSSQCT